MYQGIVRTVLGEELYRSIPCPTHELALAKATTFQKLAVQGGRRSSELQQPQVIFNTKVKK